MLGAKFAFGVSGGEIAPVWEALEYSNIETLHFRQETHAVFAACEYSIATGEPVVVFVTGGPGIANAINGLIAAKQEGARILFVAPASDPKQRGKYSVQESSHEHFPSNLLSTSSVFNLSLVVESPAQISNAILRISNLLNTPGSSVAGLFLPQNVQRMPCPKFDFRLLREPLLVACSDKTLEQCVEKISNRKLLIWVGFGGRESADLVRELVERSGALVMCSPRGKGIFPEKHPNFIGVTGLGGQDTVQHILHQFQPDICPVLGSRLGEPTSFWNPSLVPCEEIIHVDTNPKVFGINYPDHQTHAVLSDIGNFLERLIPRIPPQPAPTFPVPGPDNIQAVESSKSSSLAPAKVMQALQRAIDDDDRIAVIAESGNSFVWANHLLQFGRPTYRISSYYGSMGHATAGVLGLSLADPKRKAIAIVGDGAMLMSGTELSTAVKYQINALWVILNDSSYNMCRQGSALSGMKEIDCGIPPTNFVAFAESMGAIGYRIETEQELFTYLKLGLESVRPCVLDIVIDRDALAPIAARVFSLTMK